MYLLFFIILMAMVLPLMGTIITNYGSSYDALTNSFISALPFVFLLMFALGIYYQARGGIF